MSYENYTHLVDRLNQVRAKLRALKGLDMEILRQRAILSVKEASLQGRIDRLRSEATTYEPMYTLPSNITLKLTR